MSSGRRSRKFGSPACLIAREKVASLTGRFLYRLAAEQSLRQACCGPCEAQWCADLTFQRSLHGGFRAVRRKKQAVGVVKEFSLEIAQRAGRIA